MRREHPGLVIALAAGLVASAVLVPTSLATGIRQGDGTDDTDPAVVTTWNAIAERTIVTENATPVPVSGQYFGFVSIAVYDAVVTIEGHYRPFLKQPRAEAHASTQAAAATAAYRVLSHYFPASARQLEADYSASLSDVSSGPAKARGQEVGQAAADALIAARRNDGRDAARSLDVASGPGRWRPTNGEPMRVPWLGFVRPLVLKSPKQVEVPGPDPLDSEAYARELAEVTKKGAKDGSSRTAEQTETALFWSANPVAQYQQALRDKVTRRGMDTVTSARAFALLGTSTADALVACWRAKYDYAFWRPGTAIHLADTDGNGGTTSDPDWKPLVATPPDPEYVSSHACITGAATETFRRLFGGRSLDLYVSSPVTSTTRHFDSVLLLDDETRSSQVWQGLQFREAVDDGNRLGHQVANWVANHQFR
ncbi:hypothetical protein E0H73_05400 [Kribbella pittospori]|uniref:PA-phosphatase n=1 Tax=Kribbella pittospori TaxID=722689 RepID=A0A4R0L2E6_9ACTN|nr:vanadium-dependent haloperoxidase [Kribbella pittospori]TCC66324.1 hypothetical protein E0H73_05400 [Kribbella pittospori]